jgi:hypothetical protein
MTDNAMTKEKGETVKHWFTIHYTEINEWKPTISLDRINIHLQLNIEHMSLQFSVYISSANPSYVFYSI